jgi:outer membrane receptor protein involved in Fe transport
MNWDNWLLPKTERLGGFLRGVMDFAPNIGAFAELGYTRNVTNQSAAATPGSFTVPGSNPSNPFGSTVTAVYRLLDVGLRLNEIESDNLRAVAGLRGTAAGWDWETALNYSKNEVTNTGSNYIDIRRIRSAINGTLAGFEGTYYNLTNNAANSDALLTALRYSPVREGESSLKSVDAKASRDLFQMAGGTAALALGVEARKEDLADVPDPVSQTGNIVGSGGTSSRGDRDMKSAYVEFALPVLPKVETQLAVRYDDYSDFGSAVTPKFSASFRPTDSILLRGGWGKGFRAPSLVQMYLGESIAFPSLRDQPRCNAYTAAFGAADARTKEACTACQIRSSYAGNPNLDAEKSENIFLGVVFDVTNNLSLSLDYYNISHTNIVTSPSASFLVNNADRFPGAVVRVAQTADDIAAGAPGNLQGSFLTDQNAIGIYRSFFNATQQRTWGYDIEARYRFAVGGWGNFTAGAFATYIGSLRRQDNPGQDLVEYVDTYEMPRWRGQASLLWQTGAWSTTLAANFRSSFEQYYQAFVDRVDAYTTWDLNVQYRGFRNLTLAVGGNNIFNQDPRFADPQWSGYADGIDSPRGGFYYVRANYKFK